MKTLQAIAVWIVYLQGIVAALIALAYLAENAAECIARAFRLNRAFTMFIRGPYFQEMKRKAREEEKQEALHER